MTDFNAGTVSLEFEVRTENLRTGFRRIEKLSSRTGSISSRNFAKEFAAEKTGKKVGSDFGKGLKAATKGLGVAGKVAGVGFGAAEKVFAITKVALEAAAEIDQLSTQVGTSAEQFQELRFAAQQFGIEGNGVVDVLENMNRGVGELINTGGGEAGKALSALELSDDIKSGKLAGTVDIFDAIVDRLGGITNAQQRATLSAQIFGRENGSKLNTLLNQGSAGITKAKEEAKKLGIVLENDAVAKADDANQALEKLGKTLKGNVTRAIVEAAPEIERFAEKIIDQMPTLIEWFSIAIDKAGEFQAFVNRLAGIKKLPETIEDANQQIRQINRLNREYKAYLKLINSSGARQNQIRKAIIRGPSFREGNKLTKEFRQLDKEANSAKKSLQKSLRELFNEKDFVRFRENGLVDVTKLLLERRKELEATRSDIASEANEKAKTSESEEIATSTKFPSGEIDQSVRTRNVAAQEPIELGDEFKQVMEEVARDLDAVNALVEASRTPLEEYRAELNKLAQIQNSPGLSALAGGDETFSRARVQAVEDLANATGNYQQAISELIDLSATGAISADDFGQGFQNLTNEVETAGLAIKRITDLGASGAISPEAVTAGVDAIKASVDYQKDLNAEKQKEIEQNIALVQTEIAKQEAALELARLRGDIYSEDGVEVLQRELDILHEQISLLQAGSDLGTARGGAEVVVDNKELAQLQGQLKDTFKGAFRAALDGNFESFLSNKLKNAAANMFDRALDNLLDVIIKNLGNLFPGGGGGGIASLFAGFFATGGVIGSGKIGLVGENGPELVSAGSGPIRITPLESGLSAFSTNGLESRGSNQTNPSNVVMNISGVKDLSSFVKSQGTIEADMAAAMRRAQSDF